jgi:drug/metabolite transporter (DMT)-like permease
MWGTNWPLFPLAVLEVSVWTFRAISGFAAALLLFAVARRRGLPLALPRAAWLPVSLGALFYMTVWNVASTYAANLIPSGQAAILGFTMPLWSVLITWSILGEPLGGRMLCAVTLGAAAVTLLMVPSFAQARPWGSRWPPTWPGWHRSWCRSLRCSPALSCTASRWA